MIMILHWVENSLWLQNTGKLPQVFPCVVFQANTGSEPWEVALEEGRKAQKLGGDGRGGETQAQNRNQERAVFTI